MSESKKKRTEVEKLKEEKKGVEEELAEAMKKQEQIEHQLAVPNHLTEQIGDDFQKLYPGANILVATKKDFKKENRQDHFGRKKARS